MTIVVNGGATTTTTTEDSPRTDSRDAVLKAAVEDRVDASTLREGERVALLPKAWWDAFVRAHGTTTTTTTTATTKEGDGMRVDAIDVTPLLRRTETPMGGEDDDATTATTVRVSLSEDEDDGLRAELLEGTDFEIVREQTMQTLEEMFGHVEGSRAVYRRCLKRGENVYAEIYGLALRATFEGEETRVEASQSSTVGDLLNGVKNAFEQLRDVDQGNVRLVDYFYENRGEVMSDNPEKQIWEFNLIPGQQLLVERKVDGEWPQDGSSVIALPHSDDELTSDGFGLNVSLTPKNDVSTCEDAAKVGTRGKAGLSNLGNTCFMNSALQCLSHSSLLTDYFLSDKYLADINTDNPIGMGGELATEYANLIGALWRDGALTVTPRKFKFSLARFAPQFSGYSQQDAQELLAFLLDGLHEDLNRVKEKPYVEERDSHGRMDEDIANESWNAHTARNNSCIVDTFQGQYRSTLVCPTCENKSVKFDPFMYLSIPLPSTRERTIKVTLVSYGDEISAVTYGLKVPKNGDIATLTRAICEAADVDTMTERIVLCEVYNHRIEKTFNNMNVHLTLIGERDVLYAHRLPVQTDEDKCDTVDTVLIHRKSASINKSPYAQVSTLSSNTMVRFGFPWLVPVAVPKDSKAGPDQVAFVEEQIEKWSAKYARTLTAKPTSPSTSGDMEINGDRRLSADGNFKLKYTNNNASATYKEYGSDEAPSESHEPHYAISSSMHTVAIDWSPKALTTMYDEEKFDVVHQDESVKVNETDADMQGTPLTSCIDNFIQEEPLGKEDMWYCRHCEDHVQARKKLDLWRMPPILVMQLKRFSYSRHWRDKIDSLVDFPLNDLDMSPYVLSHAPRGTAPVYDLYAVVNHFGGMGGGHYTAYTRHAEEGTWHLYDDSHCTPVDADAALNNSAAYVLFYKRRDIPMRQTMSRAGSLCNLVDADKETQTMDCS
jgi:ubiquitin C-terminal hydrolase